MLEETSKDNQRSEYKNILDKLAKFQKQEYSRIELSSTYLSSFCNIITNKNVTQSSMPQEELASEITYFTGELEDYKTKVEGLKKFVLEDCSAENLSDEETKERLDKCIKYEKDCEKKLQYISKCFEEFTIRYIGCLIEK